MRKSDCKMNSPERGGMRVGRREMKRAGTAKQQSSSKIGARHRRLSLLPNLLQHTYPALVHGVPAAPIARGGAMTLCFVVEIAAAAGTVVRRNAGGQRREQRRTRVGQAAPFPMIAVHV